MRAGLTALALTATMACGSDNATGPGSLEDLKVADIDKASSEMVLAMSHPALQSVVQSGLYLNVAPPALKHAGLMLSVRQDPAASQVVAQSAVSALATSSAFLPAESLGKTYVFTNGSYQPDPNRTGAPANGVRIVLYQTVDASGGTVSGPEVGMLEVVDNSSSADNLSLTWRILDTQGAVLATLTTRIQGSTDANSFLMTSVGSIGTGSKTIALADTMRVTAGTNGSTSRILLSTKAPFAGLAYAFGMTAVQPASGPTTQTLQLDITLARQRLKVVVNYDSDNSARSDTVNYYLNDRLVGYALNSEQHTGLGDGLRTPTGEPVGADVKEYFNRIEELSDVLPTGLGTFVGLEFVVSWILQLD